MKNNELGENIYFLRKRKKLTQEEFAKKMKISNKTVSKWETGYSIPKFDDLLKISKYFNVPINVLINKELLDNYKIKSKFTRYLSFEYIKFFLFILMIILVLLFYKFYFKPTVRDFPTFDENLSIEGYYFDNHKQGYTVIRGASYINKPIECNKISLKIIKENDLYSYYNVLYKGYTYDEKVNINKYLNSINYIGVGILDTKRLDYTLTCDDKVIKGKVYLETD